MFWCFNNRNGNVNALSIPRRKGLLCRHNLSRPDLWHHHFPLEGVKAKLLTPTQPPSPHLYSLLKSGETRRQPCRPLEKRRFPNQVDIRRSQCFYLRVIKPGNQWDGKEQCGVPTEPGCCWNALTSQNWRLSCDLCRYRCQGWTCWGCPLQNPQSGLPSEVIHALSTCSPWLRKLWCLDVTTEKKSVLES